MAPRHSPYALTYFIILQKLVTTSTIPQSPFVTYCIVFLSWYACFMLCIVVVFQLPTLLESDCFSAIVFFATQMSIFVFLPIINFLVGLTGLEPGDPRRLSSACSNQLSYRPGLGLLRDSYQRLKISYQSLLFLSLFTETGGGTGTRTPDIQLAKLALYQLSYTPSCGSFRKKGRDARRTGSAQRRACFTHLV